MLQLPLIREDYLMVDNICLRYTRNKGSNSIELEITSPDQVRVLRQAQYEALLAQQAEQGNLYAQQELAALRTTHAKQRSQAQSRRAEHIAAQAEYSTA